MWKNLSRFSKFAWILLAYTIFVILFGAFVRATGSGAGCGAHWPLCNGVVVPRAEAIETVIELTHRLTSGVMLLMVLALGVWGFRKFPAGSLLRWSIGLTIFFTITEALVGAGLVLFELVADNDSVARAFSMMVHLVNTFLLLAAITFTAWWSSTKEPKQLNVGGLNGTLLVIGGLAMLLLGASGAVTALGDTLYPASSLAEGWQEKFSPTASYLVRMRLYHPSFAVAVGIYLFLATALVRKRVTGDMAAFLSTGLYGLYAAQFVVGIVNVALLAPVWMQIIHLLVSCLIWVLFVLFSSEALGNFAPRLRHQPVNQPVHGVPGK
jgi:heme A synthase